MPNISTIAVSYGRKIQTAPYENADASVSMTIAFDDSDEQRDIDVEIGEAMNRAVIHVEYTLGLSPSQGTRIAVAEEKPSAKPAVEEKKKTSPKPKTAPKAKEPAKKTPPKPPAQPKKVASEEATDNGSEEVLKYKKGDLMKAIGTTMAALSKKGITDGSKRVNALVEAYGVKHLGEIPEDSWGDFISDVEKLQNVSE